jgi:hypothetical protein
MLISSFFKEETEGRMRADVIMEGGGYHIRYYDLSGDCFKTEDFPGKSLRFVEDAAENWTMGIKTLNG